MIRLENVYKIYQMGDTQVRAADGINLHVQKGEYPHYLSGKDIGPR